MNSTYDITKRYLKKMQLEQDVEKRLELLSKMINKINKKIRLSFVCDYTWGTDFYKGDWESLFSDIRYYSDRWNSQRLNRVLTFGLHWDKLL